jgi:ribosomal protein S18 acetylase RimI-like enzyme
VDSPGHTGSVFLPNHIASPETSDLVVAMLGQLTDDAAGRGIRFLQGMAAPDARTECGLFLRAGFDRLTELIYLERDTAHPIPAGLSGAPVIWDEYDSANQTLFGTVIQGTYEGSLDCAALSGVRTIEDTLESHRATGEFDPRYWFLARVGSEVIGVLLLARLHERSSTEVVYMGLLPSWRGRGFGVTLLRRALDCARQQGVAILTLTVDVQNAPARKLYSAFGFHEVSRREVWMRVLRSSR